MTAPGQQPSQYPPTSGGPSAPRTDGSPAKAKRNLSIGQILGGILLVLIVVFIVENTATVKIRFIAGPKVSMPVYVALLIAAVVGALIAALLRYRRKKHHEN